MVNDCPYCGEEQSALKNHVRLASGDGHGPSGQYPDDYDDGPDQDGPDPGGGREAVALDGGGGGAVTVEAVEDAEEEGEPAEADEDETIVALPETELTALLRTAADAGEAAVSDEIDEETTEESPEELPTSEETREETPSFDADEVAAKADENGWGLGFIVALFVITVLAGSVWGALQDALVDSRSTAHQKRQQWSESDAGVEVL